MCVFQVIVGRYVGPERFMAIEMIAVYMNNPLIEHKTSYSSSFSSFPLPLSDFYELDSLSSHFPISPFAHRNS